VVVVVVVVVVAAAAAAAAAQQNFLFRKNLYFCTDSVYVKFVGN
jgi:hypothetical protein